MASGIVESSNQGSQQQQGVGRRSKLVERLLDASSSLPAFMKDLLGTMAVTVAGTEAAGFLIEQNPQNAQTGLRLVTHIRPDESDEDVRAAAIRAFQEIVGPCVQQQRDGAIDVGTPDDGEPQFCLVTLLRDQGMVVAVAAVITRCRDVERARQRLMSMQLVAGYFELYMLRRQMEQSRELAVRHQNVLQLSSSVATAEGFEAAAMGFCNELANRAGASRVSLGWVKGENIKVRALSHTEKFDKKQELIVNLKKVMEECLDQEEPVRFDADGTRSDNVTREHEALCRSQGNGSVYSIPLRRRDEIVGVITLEYTPPAKLTDDVANALAVTGDLLAPQLWDRHENDRWIIVKMGKSIAHAGKLAIGPKHMLAKLLIVVAVLATLVLGNWVPGVDLRMTYNVSAPFQFVSARKQTVSAPYDGYIEKVSVLPGQRFKKGDVLVKLRTDEYEAKRAEAQAEYDAQMATYRKKLAETAVPGAGAGKAEAIVAWYAAQRAKAQVDQYQEQINRASWKAEFDGIVLRGDLDDKTNAPVRTGDPLMEIHETGQALKAELSVPERDIHFLRTVPETEAERKDANVVGWYGKVATNGLPEKDIGIKVERIVPLGDANAKEADNTFKVYATLDEQPSYAAPGMAGEARVNAGKRTIFWVWTHRLVDWVRLKLWI